MSTKEDLFNGIKEIFQDTKTFEHLTVIFNKIPIAYIDNDILVIIFGLAIQYKNDNIKTKIIEKFKSNTSALNNIFYGIKRIISFPPSIILRDTVLNILRHTSLLTDKVIDSDQILELIQLIDTRASDTSRNDIYLPIRDILLRDTPLLVYNDHTFKGHICDTVGFRQHMGECWLDTITQLFFFADGLKEFTQSFFYTNTSPMLQEYIQKNFKPSETIPMEDFIEAMKTMQRRFINHYNFITDQGNSSCSTSAPPRPTLKRIASARNSVLTARLLRTSEKKATENFSSGGTLEWQKIIWNHLLDTFQLPYRIDRPFHVSYTIAIQIQYNYIINTTPLTFSGKGHVVGFYRCNDRWYYYDDNKELLSVSNDIISAFVSIVQAPPSDNYKLCIKIVNGQVYLILLNDTWDHPSSIFVQKEWYTFDTLNASLLSSEVIDTLTHEEIIDKTISVKYNFIHHIFFINKDPVKEANKLLIEKAGTATISASGPIHNISQIKPNSLASKEHVEAYEKAQATASSSASSSRKKNRRFKKQHRKTRRRLRN
jgi:hypothetical protein